MPQMGYAMGLSGEAATARAAPASVKAPSRPVGAAPAVKRQRDAPFCDRSHGAALGAARQATLVVAHAEHGANQNGCRNADKPQSNENQPECHALPVFAYRELYRMLHQPQDTAAVSSRTVRRNPATHGGGMTPPARFGLLCRASAHAVLPLSAQRKLRQFTTWDWTVRAFWVTSIRRAFWAACSRPWKPRMSFHSHVGKELQLPRSAVPPGDSELAAVTSPAPRMPACAPLGPGNHEYSPVKISKFRPRPRLHSPAISRSLLNAWTRRADAVPNDPTRGLA
jgi:hypothetical protein